MLQSKLNIFGQGMGGEVTPTSFPKKQKQATSMFTHFEVAFIHSMILISL